jgi:hypothetical protein
MTASSTPGHDDHDALSERERRVLADIERDLAASDPRLVGEFSRPRRYRPAPRWWPLSGPSTGLLLVGLLVLVFVGALGRSRTRHHARRRSVAAARRHREERLGLTSP